MTVFGTHPNNTIFAKKKSTNSLQIIQQYAQTHSQPTENRLCTALLLTNMAYPEYVSVPCDKRFHINVLCELKLHRRSLKITPVNWCKLNQFMLLNLKHHVHFCYSIHQSQNRHLSQNITCPWGYQPEQIDVEQVHVLRVDAYHNKDLSTIFAFLFSVTFLQRKITLLLQNTIKDQVPQETFYIDAFANPTRKFLELSQRYYKLTPGSVPLYFCKTKLYYEYTSMEIKKKSTVFSCKCNNSQDSVLISSYFLYDGKEECNCGDDEKHSEEVKELMLGNALTFKCECKGIINVKSCAKKGCLQKQVQGTFTDKAVTTKTQTDQVKLNCGFADSTIDVYKLCILEKDQNGNIMNCWNAAHLTNCFWINCPNSHKCQDSYCVKYRHVCDGVWDCPHGDDEKLCSERKCHKNFFKCYDSNICLHVSEICDGMLDCLYGDDEMFCEIENCPNACACLNYAIKCLNQTVLPPTLSFYIYIVLQNVLVPVDYNTLQSFHLGHFIDLQNNAISDICASVGILQNIQELFFQVVNLDNNKISQITKFCFRDMPTIQKLMLSFNCLSLIADKAFENLGQLKFLNISHNEVHTVSQFTFVGLLRMQHLDMHNNDILDINPDALNLLQSLNRISVNDNLCCLAQMKLFCWPGNDPSEDACVRLLQTEKTKHALFSLVSLGLLTNAISSFVNTTKRKIHNTNVLFLNFTTVWLAVYVTLILLTDYSYQEEFGFFKKLWQSNFLCYLAAFSYLLYFLSSKLMLACMVVIVFILVKHPFYFHSNMTTHKVTRMLFLLILCCVFVSFTIVLCLVLSNNFLFPSPLCSVLDNTEETPSTTDKILLLTFNVVLCICCPAVFCFAVHYVMVNQKDTKNRASAQLNKGTQMQSKLVTSPWLVSALTMNWLNWVFQSLVLALLIRNRNFAYLFLDMTCQVMSAFLLTLIPYLSSCFSRKLKIFAKKWTWECTPFIPQQATKTKRKQNWTWKWKLSIEAMKFFFLFQT